MSDSDKKGKCAENEYQNELHSESHDLVLVHRGPRSLSDSSPSTEIKTPILEIKTPILDNNQKPAPETKFFYNQPEQDVNALPRNVPDGEETEIEIEPSEVTEILKTCAENENPKTSLDFSPLKEIKTHTCCWIWYGKDDVVDLEYDHLFLANENEDTALHVAARAGNVPTVKKLLKAYANFQRRELAEAWARYNKDPELAEDYNGMMNMGDLMGLVKKENVQGNTMLHEAMICGSKCKIGANIFQAFKPYNIEDHRGDSLSKSCYEYALNIANHAKKSVLYLAVEAGDKEAVKLILHNCPEDAKLVGLSPLVAAIMKRDRDMLTIMLDKKPDWIHLRDQHERLPLHYAASTGYHKGVVDLLGKCNSCSIKRDKYGYFPLHLAAQGGHVDVVKELSGDYSYPTEMLDDSKRNIFHIATKCGKHEVVRYILQTAKLCEMINQKDKNGDTPLHLATRLCHPKTVYYLTWDDRVDLGLVNQKNETALDIVNALYRLDNSSLRQQLAWTALKSAGAKPSSSRVPQVESKPSDMVPNEKSPKKEACGRYSDRVETLTVVSTLIITTSVAACLAVPGEADGTANNLYHAMFQFFIISITISFFSSISATIILFWARLGLIELLAFSLKIVTPLLGVSLISLSLAFLAGVFTVIKELSWLATVFVVMTVIFVVVVSLLYILLFLPSSSTRKPLRYISYYPFPFLAWVAQSKTIQGTNF